MPIETRLLIEHDDILARTLRIKHARGSLETPAHAVSILDIGRAPLGESDLQGIVEVPVVFKPEHLEAMGRSTQRQRQFEYRMNSYLGRIPSSQLTIAVPLLEAVRGAEFSRDKAPVHAAYIAELVAHPRMDVVCTPVFHGVIEEQAKALLEEFLHTMTTYSVGVALSIPYTSRETRQELIGTYFRWVDKNNKMLLNIVCVDYNGSNPISKYSLHNYVTTYTRTLQRETGEPVAVHGVNVKYSRIARKYDELPARDLTSYYAQLDMFGGTTGENPFPEK